MDAYMATFFGGEAWDLCESWVELELVQVPSPLMVASPNMEAKSQPLSLKKPLKYG